MDIVDAVRKALNSTCEAEDNRNPHARGDWLQFNTGSVEVEVGLFLYALTRLLKPRLALETGTYHGVSAAFVALAMADNELGRLVTLETNRAFCEDAKELMFRLGVRNRVHVVNQSSVEYMPEAEVDLLFLDSEPDLRFAEFDRFWPHVAPGGLILIHDLHWHLGLTWYKNNGMVHWPYGDFRQHEVGRRLLSHELQVIPFFTPRGLVMFQKAHPEFLHPRYLAGTLEEREVWS